MTPEGFFAEIKKAVCNTVRAMDGQDVPIGTWAVVCTFIEKRTSEDVRAHVVVTDARNLNPDLLKFVRDEEARLRAEAQEAGPLQLELDLGQ
jgi:hypothetical protein